MLVVTGMLAVTGALIMVRKLAVAGMAGVVALAGVRLLPPFMRSRRGGMCVVVVIVHRSSRPILHVWMNGHERPSRSAGSRRGLTAGPD